MRLYSQHVRISSAFDETYPVLAVVTPDPRILTAMLGPPVLLPMRVFIGPYVIHEGLKRQYVLIAAVNGRSHWPPRYTDDLP